MGLRVRHSSGSTDSDDRTAGGRGSWKLEVKVGSLQKSNITRAADRDGVTNCNRRVRKMHRGSGEGGGKVEGTVSFRRDERNPNDPSKLLDMRREC